MEPHIALRKVQGNSFHIILHRELVGTRTVFITLVRLRLQIQYFSWVGGGEGRVDVWG